MIVKKQHIKENMLYLHSKVLQCFLPTRDVLLSFKNDLLVENEQPSHSPYISWKGFSCASGMLLSAPLYISCHQTSFLILLGARNIKLHSSSSSAHESSTSNVGYFPPTWPRFELEAHFQQLCKSLIGYEGMMRGFHPYPFTWLF